MISCSGIIHESPGAESRKGCRLRTVLIDPYCIHLETRGSERALLGDRPALGTGNNAAQWVNGNFSAGMGVLGTVVATATYSTHSSSLVTWEMSDGVGNSG